MALLVGGLPRTRFRWLAAVTEPPCEREPYAGHNNEDAAVVREVDAKTGHRVFKIKFRRDGVTRNVAASNLEYHVCRAFAWRRCEELVPFTSISLPWFVSRLWSREPA